MRMSDAQGNPHRLSYCKGWKKRGNGKQHKKERRGGRKRRRTSTWREQEGKERTTKGKEKEGRVEEGIGVEEQEESEAQGEGSYHVDTVADDQSFYPCAPSDAARQGACLT